MKVIGVALTSLLLSAAPQPSSLPALHSVASTRLGFTLDLPGGLAVEHCGERACLFARSEDAGAGLRVEIQILPQAPAIDDELRRLAGEGWRESERRQDRAGHLMVVLDGQRGETRVWYLHRTPGRALLAQCTDRVSEPTTLIAICRSLRALR
ncbi:MAG: hypothetical protein ABIJ09_16195 [Pseudomonadota bacterium]